MTVHQLYQVGRLIPVAPEGACCPFCRKPLPENPYLSRWCNSSHYNGWVTAEAERAEKIENGELEPDEIYHEPLCEVCKYWFPTEEALAAHKQAERETPSEKEN